MQPLNSMKRECQQSSDKLDQILESNKFTAAQIRCLNYCRLFLQAITLSDITDASSTSLDLNKLAKTRHHRAVQRRGFTLNKTDHPKMNGCYGEERTNYGAQQMENFTHRLVRGNIRDQSNVNNISLTFVNDDSTSESI